MSIGDAFRIMENNKVDFTLTLYETPETAKSISQNLYNHAIMVFSLNTYLNKGENYYDQFTMVDSIIKKKYNVKSIEEYKKTKCAYTRCLAVNTKTKSKIIEYRVYNPNKLQNPIILCR